MKEEKVVIVVVHRGDDEHMKQIMRHQRGSRIVTFLSKILILV